MSRRLSRLSLALFLLLSGHVWALGLGEIRLESALNEPLRAEIELLSATSEELGNLKVTMAEAPTFDRYGLDRPVFLQSVEFMVVGNVVEIRSRAPITEPFLTFLVEASWPRGRLLREYTVLLDPPTFAAPTQSRPTVTAPQRSTPADSGRIEREQPRPAPQSSPPPAQSRPPVESPAPVRSEPRPTPADRQLDEYEPYDSVAGGDFYVERGQNLWGIARRVRPDSRLTMNQTMLAIFAANPEAFNGNINLLRAGASLRIPSADEIFRISRGDALNEAKRHHAAWGGSAAATVPIELAPRPSLTLVPPDDDLVAEYDAVASDFDSEPLSREQEIEQRISELQAADVPEQRSLIEIRDNELAELRGELARIRGEIYEPPVDDIVVEDDLADDTVVDDDTADIMVDQDAADAVDDTGVADDQTSDVAETTPAVKVITTRPRAEPSLVDKAIAALTSIWAIIFGALLIAVGVLLWFMRRDRDVDDESGAWEALDADEMEADSLSATETMHAPLRSDESFVVVEQDSAILPPISEDTIETLAPEIEPVTDTTGSFDSLEDTFSSETAVNLDQSDPAAEADFHMAYGLYDQAADLINGALAIEPERPDLLTKLCEIYFVWGNRDEFIDAASRLTATIGGEESADWDKIVIMGQQIAADHEMFVGAGSGAPTKAVDLPLDAEMEDAGALDMELDSGDGSAVDLVDLGTGLSADDTYDKDIDFLFQGEQEAGNDVIADEETEIDVDITRESATIDALATDDTVEMPRDEPTVETPTVEQPVDGLNATAELPSIKGAIDAVIESSGQSADETAEINVDDLGLDISGLDETEFASLEDDDAESDIDELSTTGLNEALEQLSEITSENPQIDPDITGTNLELDSDDLDEATDVGIDESLLEATGITQVLGEGFAVQSGVHDVLLDEDATMLAPVDDEDTMLAGLDDDPEDFDFAKTEALPPDVFSGKADLDETGELPTIASTDFDLDLDDLTTALKAGDMGDTADQPRDDATVEQPRPTLPQSADETAETQALAPGELSEDLHDARTMTEVGTKLDLARAYVDMGDPAGARSILEEVLDEGDEGQRQQAQQLLDSIP